MPEKLYPHQIFEADFKQLFDEAERQETSHLENKGELAIAKRLYEFISDNVGSGIENNEWVYAGASQFASEFSPQYFHRIRLTGEQTVKYQNQLHNTNEEVVQILAGLAIQGKAPQAGKIDLKKASDFISLISLDKLTDDERRMVSDLEERVKDHEILHLKLTLDAISDLYEIGLPRVMFVFRRALKVNLGKRPSRSDVKLNPPSNYIDWISGNLDNSHVLVDYIASKHPGDFYRTSRNVANHHRGLHFNVDTNLIKLEDDRLTLDVPLYEFQQRYRYLTYLVDYGVRGILFHFSRKECGEISFRICNDYEKTFPRDMDGISQRKVKPYE